MSLCSLVSCTHNQLAFTKLFIDSVFKCTDFPFELIMVDNSSTDGTAEYLSGLQNVRLIRNDRNLGCSAGWNQGIKAAQGNYVIVCNNDIVVTPGWLRALITALEEDDRLGMAVPVSNIQVMHFDAQYPEEAVYLRKRHNAGPTWELMDVSYSGFYNFARAFTQKYGKRRLSHPSFECVALRRSVIDDVGLFDEGFGLAFMEDVDYVQRILLNHRHNLAVSCGSAYIHHFGNVTTSKVGGSVLFEQAKKHFHSKWAGVDSQIYQDYIQGRLDQNDLYAWRKKLLPKFPFLSKDPNQSRKE